MLGLSKNNDLTGHNDCIIRDGQIIPAITVKKPGQSRLEHGLRFKDSDLESELSITPSEPVLEPDPPKHKLTQPKIFPLGETSSMPDMSAFLPACKEYLPCYLTDGSVADYGLFEHHMKESMGLVKRTRKDFLFHLRIWKTKLNGEITAEKIQNHLNSNPMHGYNRFLAFKKYADYRKMLGDPRLSVILALSNIQPPARPSKNADLLGPKELDMYRSHARRLTQQGDRNGLWLGSLLAGLKPGEIETMTFQNHGSNKLIIQRKLHTGVKELKFDAPQWLIDGLQAIPEEQWRRKCVTVTVGVKEYGTNSRQIMSSVAHHQRNNDSGNFAFPNGKRPIPRKRKNKRLANT